MKKIVVPTDFSAAALNAANYAIEMALTIGAGNGNKKRQSIP